MSENETMEKMYDPPRGSANELIEWSYWALVNNGEASLFPSDDIDDFRITSVWGKPMTLIVSFMAKDDIDEAKIVLDTLLPNRHSIRRWYR